jgi:hypothetical protein
MIAKDTWPATEAAKHPEEPLVTGQAPGREVNCVTAIQISLGFSTAKE